MPNRRLATHLSLQVMAAQANFVRVRVDSLEGGEPGELPPRPRLLCVVRALLKKIKQVRSIGCLAAENLCSAVMLVGAVVT